MYKLKANGLNNILDCPLSERNRASSEAKQKPIIKASQAGPNDNFYVEKHETIQLNSTGYLLVFSNRGYLNLAID